jgi:hypothetical protein
MPHIDWESIRQQANGIIVQKKRFAGANVKFFYAYNENEEKSLKEGRPIFDEIPSISIQWPGMDETVRRIEPQDIQEYPEAYARFTANSEPITEGTPLAEWPIMNGSAMRELQYLGFRSVEQVANASDEAKRKLGTLSKFVKLAQEWLAAANSTQNEVVKLKLKLEQEQNRTAKLEEKVELLLQRISANEGTDLRTEQKEVIPSIEAEDEIDFPVSKRRGRPRKV